MEAGICAMCFSTATSQVIHTRLAAECFMSKRNIPAAYQNVSTGADALLRSICRESFGCTAVFSPHHGTFILIYANVLKTAI